MVSPVADLQSQFSTFVAGTDKADAVKKIVRAIAEMKLEQIAQNSGGDAEFEATARVWFDKLRGEKIVLVDYRGVPKWKQIFCNIGHFISHIVRRRTYVVVNQSEEELQNKINAISSHLKPSSQAVAPGAASAESVVPNPILKELGGALRIETFPIEGWDHGMIHLRSTERIKAEQELLDEWWDEKQRAYTLKKGEGPDKYYLEVGRKQVPLVVQKGTIEVTIDGTRYQGSSFAQLQEALLRGQIVPRNEALKRAWTRFSSMRDQVEAVLRNAIIAENDERERLVNAMNGFRGIPKHNKVLIASDNGVYSWKITVLSSQGKEEQTLNLSSDSPRKLLLGRGDELPTIVNGQYLRTEILPGSASDEIFSIEKAREQLSKYQDVVRLLEKTIPQDTGTREDFEEMVHSLGVRARNAVLFLWDKEHGRIEASRWDGSCLSRVQIDLQEHPGEITIDGRHFSPQYPDPVQLYNAIFGTQENRFITQDDLNEVKRLVDSQERQLERFSYFIPDGSRFTDGTPFWGISRYGSQGMKHWLTGWIPLLGAGDTRGFCLVQSGQEDLPFSILVDNNKVCFSIARGSMQCQYDSLEDLFRAFDLNEQDRFDRVQERKKFIDSQQQLLEGSSLYFGDWGEDLLRECSKEAARYSKLLKADIFWVMKHGENYVLYTMRGGRCEEAEVKIDDVKKQVVIGNETAASIAEYILKQEGLITLGHARDRYQALYTEVKNRIEKQDQVGWMGWITGQSLKNTYGRYFVGGNVSDDELKTVTQRALRPILVIQKISEGDYQARFAFQEDRSFKVQRFSIKINEDTLKLEFDPRLESLDIMVRPQFVGEEISLKVNDRVIPWSEAQKLAS